MAIGCSRQRKRIARLISLPSHQVVRCSTSTASTTGSALTRIEKRQREYIACGQTSKNYSASKSATLTRTPSA